MTVRFADQNPCMVWMLMVLIVKMPVVVPDYFQIALLGLERQLYGNEQNQVGQG
jgi:hypothetical protein